MNKIEDKHFFLDGYSLNQALLSNPKNMERVLKRINKIIFRNNGKIILIPYFNGKIKEDGGVSGIVLGNNSHFTCHTFCYKNIVFVDYYGDKTNHELVKNIVLDTYKTKDIDLCKLNSGLKGNFGKHIIVKSNKLYTYDEAKKLIRTILKDIEMTPIKEVITTYKEENEYDLLQPIAESHISIHRKNDDVIVDAFSCKYFDEQKILKLLNVSEFDMVSRGIRYK